VDVIVAKVGNFVGFQVEHIYLIDGNQQDNSSVSSDYFQSIDEVVEAMLEKRL
jgi:hypothetical protein